MFPRVVLPLRIILGQLTPNTGKLCLGRMVGVKFQKIWLEYAKISGNSSRCELPFWGGSLSSATSFQQAAGSGSQRLFCAPTTSTGCHQRCPLSSGFWGLSVNQLGPLKKDCIEPLQAYQEKSTISVAAGFFAHQQLYVFGCYKITTQQSLNQSGISPYESQALIDGNDGLHYPWPVGNWIHSGTVDLRFSG